MDFDAQLLEAALEKYNEIYGEDLYSQLLDLLDNDIDQAESILTEFIAKYRQEIFSLLKT